MAHGYSTAMFMLILLALAPGCAGVGGRRQEALPAANGATPARAPSKQAEGPARGGVCAGRVYELPEVFFAHRQAGQPALRLAGLPAYGQKTFMREDKRLRLREIAMPGFYLVFLPLAQTLQSPSTRDENERSRQNVQP